MNTKELQATVNPSFTTAKSILNMLIAGGDADALKLAPHLNLSNISKSETEKKIPPEMLNCFKIGQMAKFDIHNSAVLKSGKPTIIDLPCGYATRCFKVADNGQKYYGLDLPIVIDEMKELTSKIMTEKQKELITFKAVDATNYNSMRQALSDVKGEICIITEGLLAYFNDSELICLCKGIHKLLSEFGGCWITADGCEIKQIYPLTIGVLFQGDKEKVSKIMQKVSDEKSQVHSGINALTSNKCANAREFMENQGFIIKEESVSKYLDKLKCCPEDKQEALFNAYSKLNIWTMTVDKKDEIFTNEYIFNLESNLEDGVFKIKISGRLDTLTAPELLKKFKENEGIKQILVDVSKMTFISSAGLRVLEIMLKELNNKEMFEIIGANEKIKEIMKNSELNLNMK